MQGDLCAGKWGAVFITLCAPGGHWNCAAAPKKSHAREALVSVSQNPARGAPVEESLLSFDASD